MSETPTPPETPENPTPQALSEDQILEEIQKGIQQNQVMIFMKGTPDFPMCGFSGRAVEILKSMGRPFAAMNVLADPRIRQVLSAHSDWPTIPQIFVDGEFVGGCDILVEMHEKNELKPLVEKAFEGGSGEEDSAGDTDQAREGQGA